MPPKSKHNKEVANPPRTLPNASFAMALKGADGRGHSQAATGVDDDGDAFEVG